MNKTKMAAAQTKKTAPEAYKTENEDGPRQHRVIKSAATKLIPVLINSGVAIVRDQLDELMPQFKEGNPGFYNGYFAARVVVNQGSRKRGKAEAKSDATATDGTVKTDAPVKSAA